MLLTVVGIVLWDRRKTRNILESLNQMLDVAIEGAFTEEHFDESMLSAVETKLAHYLASSTVSAKNVRVEKERIKTLISDISHQTKTPISNIRLYTQLLQEQTLSEEGNLCVDALEQQTEKLQMLIEALVKISRLESGIITLYPEEGQLTSMIQAAASQLAPKAEQKHIKITFGDLDGSAVFDARWTEEALFNLLDNAVKYTPDGGSVYIQVKEFPLFAAIEVTDTGPGIAEEEQPKIFQRFYRGMAPNGEDGVGIGLYLARQIAEDQGGYMKVSSVLGQGSTFSLYLPRT